MGGKHTTESKNIPKEKIIIHQKKEEKKPGDKPIKWFTAIVIFSVFFWFYKQTNQKFLIIIQISSEWEKQQNQWQISTNQVIQIRKFEFDKIIIFSVGFFSNEKIEIKNSKFSIPNQ